MTGPQKVVLLACGSYNPPTNLHLRMFELARDYLHRTTNFHVIAGLISPVHDKYGKEGLAGSNDRCQMVRLALTSSNWIHLSDWETRQEEWTPTREVLQHHQRLIRSHLYHLRLSNDPKKMDLMDSAVNGNLDGTVKRQRMDNTVPWLSHLTTSLASVPVTGGGGGRHMQHEPVTVKLLCGADLLESFGKPGVWKEEDIETIIGKFGLVVITREGSNPYKFIYESDTLSRLQRNIHIVTEWITNEVSSTRVRRALKRGESVKYLLQDPVIDFIYKHVLYDTHNKPSVNCS
ncbi:Cytidyltransferase-like domain [Trinorchestia longiramus]|nr:Cytidyltransferase-like domain [Trinorchestia longiramus]